MHVEFDPKNLFIYLRKKKNFNHPGLPVTGNSEVRGTRR